MRLESLSLQDFRNYERVSLELNPGLNIFVGDNAQGKPTSWRPCMYWP